MRKQSIATRKYLERVEKNDPKRYEEIKRRKKFSAAKSFIKLHARPPELVELDQLIKEKQKEQK